MTKDISETNQTNIDTLTPEQINKLSGTDVTAFAKKLLTQLSIVDASPLSDSDDDINQSKELAYAMISNLGPQNGLQAMLATQLSAVHSLQLHCAMASKHAKHLDHKKTYANLATKLANTFVQQANAFNKLQGNGQQKVLVEHVNVHAGGHAVVGTINHDNKRGADEK